MIARSALAVGDEAVLDGAVRAPRAMSARQSSGGGAAGAVRVGPGWDGCDGAGVVGGEAAARGVRDALARGAGVSRSGIAMEGAGDTGRRTADDGLMIVMGVTAREDVGKRTSVGVIRKANHASK
ncbi:hypothetical protein [Pandoraea pulmonicola]|uniref:Uncharacterized protein n=1 Tax=Pandoraea pulmonicola TaxID=93221 RepID=A0ABN4EP55_PANPU|nr:hypothetical protein [Pandoraea pulmonicola]AJC20137.1 hypothetical protein RO07_06015 [Pandoraea pulmonicola]